MFDGPEDYHARIDDPALAIDADTMLFMRGAGPIGYPGAAEVVNMRAPDYLIKRGRALAALHRRRPPVRHLGLALDPQRLARGGGRRRPRAAARPATGCASTSTRAPPTSWCRDEELARAARGARRRRRLRVSGAPDAVAGDPARHRRPDGDRRRAGAGGRSTSASPRPRACRATTTSDRRGGTRKARDPARRGVRAPAPDGLTLYGRARSISIKSGI